MREGGDQAVDCGRDIGALLAAIPAMLGFIPENSMVLLGLSTPQRPAGYAVPDNASEVGPVVRAELVEQAVETAAAVVIQAHQGREEKEAIIVVIGGDATPLISCAHRCLQDSGIQVPAAFVVAEMSGGALWWEVPAEGRMSATADGGQLWRAGELPDPRRSRALRRELGRWDKELLGQQRFAAMLDPVPLSETLEGVLPESWRDSPGWAVPTREMEGGGEPPPELCPEQSRMGRNGTGVECGLEASGETQSAYSVCVLIDELAHDLDKLAPSTSSTGALIHFLHRAGRASRIAEACDDPRLFPVLLALAAGSGRGTVTSLLLGTAQVARGLLRQRALALLAVVAWWATGGVVAHRAAYRAITEIRHTSGPGWVTGTGEERTHNLARAEVTIALASHILRAIEQAEASTKALDILAILDEGMDLIEQVLTIAEHAGGEDSERARALLGRVVDRQGFSRVRSELENRVVR